MVSEGGRYGAVAGEGNNGSFVWQQKDIILVVRLM